MVALAQSAGLTLISTVLNTSRTYRGFNLKYTTDLYCGLKFKQTLGGQICSVDRKVVTDFFA